MIDKHMLSTYGVMAAVWVDGERKGIANEMFTKPGTSTEDFLEVETRALVVLQARGGTV